MHYNLLMYGNNYGGCNQSNNSMEAKNQYLNNIVEYVKPDILTVNEIYKSSVTHEYLLNYALNVDGIDYFEMGDPPNIANSYIMNQIYYNTEKISIESNIAITTNYRDIDIFTVKYSSDKLFADPVYLNCVVAHLKAGNSYEDEVERSNETNKLMNYLDNTNASGNYLMLGDFNVYTASEQAFQNLLFHSNESIRFYDPINALGSWHINPNYSDVHTQSTHSYGSCASGGGMDDRFDFILVSDEILSGSNYAKYISDSYWAVGQDGNHFDNSLLDPPQNTSVPASVLNALYGMSDHLPVVLELIVGENVGISDINSNNFSVSIQNPVSDNLSLSIVSDEPVELTLKIVNIQGKLLKEEIFAGSGKNSLKMETSKMRKGIYFLIVSDKSSGVSATKFMKF